MSSLSRQSVLISVWTMCLAKQRKRTSTIIAYDRLIMDSDAVDYFVTYDFYQAGQMQARSISSKNSISTTQAVR